MKIDGARPIGEKPRLYVPRILDLRDIFKLHNRHV